MRVTVWLVLAGCIREPDRPNANELARHADDLAACRAVGRDAGADGGYAAYEWCKRHRGIREP